MCLNGRRSHCRLSVPDTHLSNTTHAASHCIVVIIAIARDYSYPLSSLFGLADMATRNGLGGAQLVLGCAPNDTRKPQAASREADTTLECVCACPTASPGATPALSNAGTPLLLTRYNCVASSSRHSFSIPSILLPKHCHLTRDSSTPHPPPP